MFKLNTFEDFLVLGLSCVIAYVFFVYINGFLDYNFGQGERKARSEAIDSVINATTLAFIVVGVWVVYKFIVSVV
jgi:hypothetical protein